MSATVTGTLTEQGVGPLVGIRVDLWRYDDNRGGYVFATVVTDAAGHYSFTVSLTGLIISPGTLTFQVRVKSSIGRVIYKSLQFDVGLTGTQDHSASIPGPNLRGPLVTNLSPTGTAAFVSQNNFIMPFVDNASAWFQIEDAVSRATTEVDLLLFYFDVGNVFFFFTPDPPTIGIPTQGVRLETLLLLATQKTPPVAVRLAIRRATGLPYPIQTAGVVEDFFAQTRVAVREIATDPRVPMHAKAMTVDNTGFLVGSPFLQEYFDANTHFVDDPRRGRMSVFTVVDSLNSGIKNSTRTPIHDVTAQLQGPIVGDLRTAFFFEWNNVGANDGAATPVGPAATPNASAQLVRTLPGNTFPNLSDGETGVLEGYLRIFEQATTYIYLENQYITEDLIYDGLRLTLRAAAARGAPLQVIIVTNRKMDIPGYNETQTRNILSLFAGLKADGTDSRLGVFTLWSVNADQSKPRIINTYVHSKVGIVDDQWATIGSGNLDGVSLNTSTFFTPVLAPADENRRGHEVNALIFNGIAGQTASPVPAQLRQALWGEHLGLSPSAPELVTPPTGGWLALWKQVASTTLSNLKAHPTIVPTGRVLQWVPKVDSEDYLRASGVDVRNYRVLSEVRSFDFTTGQFIDPP